MTSLCDPLIQTKAFFLIVYKVKTTPGSHFPLSNVRDRFGYHIQYNLCLRRYYVGLGLSSAVLLILVCFSLGVFYGMCGKRPGGLYGDECCNKVPHYSSILLI
jgi:hypothetical protein